MFRERMSLEGPTHLYVLVRGVKVTLAAVGYQEEIIWVPSGAWHCVWYVAEVCQHFPDDEYMDNIDCPTHSPPLNPIQHLWDIMYHCIHRPHVPTHTVQELTDVLIQVWEEIPRDTICHRQHWATFWPVLGWISLRCHFFTLVSNINLNPADWWVWASTECSCVHLLRNLNI